MQHGVNAPRRLCNIKYIKFPSSNTPINAPSASPAGCNIGSCINHVKCININHHHHFPIMTPQPMFIPRHSKSVPLACTLSAYLTGWALYLTFQEAYAVHIHFPCGLVSVFNLNKKYFSQCCRAICILVWVRMKSLLHRIRSWYWLPNNLSQDSKFNFKHSEIILKIHLVKSMLNPFMTSTQQFLLP